MWRAMRNLFLLALLVVFIAWMIQDPGSVLLQWGGYEVRTNLFVAISAVVLALALLLFLARLLSSGLAIPRRIAQRRRAGRLQEACRLFCEAMTAAAAQDKPQALALARKGMERMNSFADSSSAADNRHAPNASPGAERDLALLLATRIAHLAGDKKAAEEYARQMLARPRLEFLAARNLFLQAQERNDALGALEYARRALALRKDAAWAARAVFEHAAARKQWWEALAALDMAQRAKAFGENKEKRYRALILTALAATAESEGRFEDALRQSVEATNLLPQFAPSAALAARLCAKGGKLRKGERLLETAWAANPHPQLVDVWMHLHKDETAEESAKSMERLTRNNRAHAESRIALTRSRMATKEWTLARGLLLPLAEDVAAERRICSLMAQIEAGLGNSAAAAAWQSRAETAQNHPRWHCQGYESDEWQPVCPTCGIFDSLEWGAPPSASTPRLNMQAGDMLKDTLKETTASPATPAESKGARQEPSIPSSPPDDPGPKPQPARDAGA